jgi:hypothetical protein
MSLPDMNSNGIAPLKVFTINDEYIVGIYKGSLSEFDLLIKYRQKFDNKWSRLRTPKHIHWAVDIIIKYYLEEKQTKKLLEYLLELWDKNIKAIKSEDDRNQLLNTDDLIIEVNNEALKYPKLAQKGEYSIKFLLLLARLLMIQEKTNLESAYMFKNLLQSLKKGDEIFKIISTATHR